MHADLLPATVAEAGIGTHAHYLRFVRHVSPPYASWGGTSVFDMESNRMYTRRPVVDMCTAVRPETSQYRAQSALVAASKIVHINVRGRLELQL